jgi:hypothetical protein
VMAARLRVSVIDACLLSPPGAKPYYIRRAAG